MLKTVDWQTQAWVSLKTRRCFLDPWQAPSSAPRFPDRQENELVQDSLPSGTGLICRCLEQPGLKVNLKTQCGTRSHHLIPKDIWQMLGGPMNTNLLCECLGKDTHPAGIICVNTTGSLFNILSSSTTLEKHSQVAHLKQWWNLDQFILNMLLSKHHTMMFLGKCPNSLSHQFFSPPPPMYF